MYRYISVFQVFSVDLLGSHNSSSNSKLMLPGKLLHGLLNHPHKPCPSHLAVQAAKCTAVCGCLVLASPQTLLTQISPVLNLQGSKFRRQAHELQASHKCGVRAMTGSGPSKLAHVPDQAEMGSQPYPRNTTPGVLTHSDGHMLM